MYGIIEMANIYCPDSNTYYSDNLHKQAKKFKYELVQLAGCWVKMLWDEVKASKSLACDGGQKYGKCWMEKGLQKI